MDLINLAGHSVDCPAYSALSSFGGMTSNEDLFQFSSRCCDAAQDQLSLGLDKLIINPPCADSSSCGPKEFCNYSVRNPVCTACETYTSPDECTAMNTSSIAKRDCERICFNNQKKKSPRSAAKMKSKLISDVDQLLSDDHQSSTSIQSKAQDDGESSHPDANSDGNGVVDMDSADGGGNQGGLNVNESGDGNSDKDGEESDENQTHEEDSLPFNKVNDERQNEPTISPTESVEKFITDSFLPAQCPGSLIFHGINDPRDVVISKAMISGVGPPDKPRGVNDKDLPAKVFQTGEFNQRQSHWIVVTKNDMSFHMVMIEIRSISNEAYGCVTQAGYFSLHPNDLLDYDTVMKAWAGRDAVDLATCDDCVGYGISKGLTLTSAPYTYAGTVNKYQSSSYIHAKCPGERLGHAQSMDNVTVDEIDSYAGLAFLGGANIDGSLVTSEGVKPHPAVVFYNTKIGSAKSYIAAYVDIEASELRMVEMHLSVDTDAGRVRVCAPQAKTYSDVPDFVDSSNIISFWNEGEKMNVASCQKCAGYGVTMFRFNVDEKMAASPVPTAEPTLMPSPEPSVEPTPPPTMIPTELPEGSMLAPDAADGNVDGIQMVVPLPVAAPTEVPIITPTFAPISGPTFHPVAQPTSMPVNNHEYPPTLEPSIPRPTEIVTGFPISDPTMKPVANPTLYPVMDPTKEPVATPTQEPTPEPTYEKLEPCAEKDYIGEVIPAVTVDGQPLVEDSAEPTYEPSLRPTHGPTLADPVPTFRPTQEPTTAFPTREPTFGPTFISQEIYGMETTASPTFAPTLQPTDFPSVPPSAAATNGATLGGPCLDTGEVFAPVNDNMGTTDNTEGIPGGLGTHTSPTGDFAVDIFKYHNDLRQQCSSSTHSLTWNQNLAEYAQSYAEILATQNNCGLSHTFGGHASYSDKNAGENLAMYISSAGVDPSVAAMKAVNGWAGEGYGDDATGGTTGHYTAMMWKDTTELGCGYGINEAANCIVTACNYASVAPNMMGQYDMEVLCASPFSVANNRRLSTTNINISELKECTEYYGFNYNKTMKMVKLSGRPMTKEATSGRVTAPHPENKTTPLQMKNITSVTEMSTAERRQFFLRHFAKPKSKPAPAGQQSPSNIKAPTAGSDVIPPFKVAAKKDVRSMSTTERRQFYLDHFSAEALARKSKTLRGE